jgi:hypothetical protein
MCHDFHDHRWTPMAGHKTEPDAADQPSD